MFKTLPSGRGLKKFAFGSPPEVVHDATTPVRHNKASYRFSPYKPQSYLGSTSLKLSPSKSAAPNCTASLASPEFSDHSVDTTLELSPKRTRFTQEKIDQIAEEVRKDIVGIVALPQDDSERVKIGDISLQVDKWKRIKGQKKNSLFVKKLAISHYGPDGLAKRTVGNPKTQDSGKKMATPAKVDSYVAALKGYILAKDPKDLNAHVAAAAARSILSSKMQDEALLSEIILQPQSLRLHFVSFVSSYNSLFTECDMDDSGAKNKGNSKKNREKEEKKKQKKIS
ncbi:hypothetical protein ONE63_011440 [Megalurothrips usitatus]|uniref:Uncharacterized protein n=1 Tax=Megalurothrips usitatus TaxID=439358 RepID=A0AAV7X323_9NEOP|nr:hypothetical protein ONE63_011440 [Megalurothrips usitatus]